MPSLTVRVIHQRLLLNQGLLHRKVRSIQSPNYLRVLELNLTAQSLVELLDFHLEHTDYWPVVREGTRPTDVLFTHDKTLALTLEQNPVSVTGGPLLLGSVVDIATWVEFEGWHEFNEVFSEAI